MDIGARLRDAREARGLSLEAVSRSTRVQPRILSAIELNDSIAIPPRPYGRGFVRAYASEVGLDPEATVRDFFSQFAPRVDTPDSHTPIAFEDSHREPSARPWIWPVSGVIAYAAVGALVIFAGRWVLDRAADPGPAPSQRSSVRAPESAPPPRATPNATDPAVGTVGASVPTTTASVNRASATPPTQGDGVTIALEAQGPSWIDASVDGQRAIYRTLQPGERVSLKGTREVSVRAGDAGAVRWQVNGRPAAIMGQPGKVRTERVTPENANQVK